MPAKAPRCVVTLNRLNLDRDRLWWWAEGMMNWLWWIPVIAQFILFFCCGLFPYLFGYVVLRHFLPVRSDQRWRAPVLEKRCDCTLTLDLYSPLSLLFSEKADLDKKMLVVSFFLATGAELQRSRNTTDNICLLYISLLDSRHETGKKVQRQGTEKQQRSLVRFKNSRCYG